MPFLWVIVIQSFTSAFLLGLMVFSWRQRQVPGAYGLSLVLVCLSGAVIANTLNLANGTLAGKISWMKITYLFWPFLPIAALVLVAEMIGRETWQTRLWHTWFLALPSMMVGLVLTNDWHQLFRSHLSLMETGPWIGLAWKNGPVFWAYSVYAYGSLVLLSAILLGSMRRRSHLYRVQAALLITSMAFPVAVELAFSTRLLPWPGFNPGYPAYLFTGLVLSLAIFRYRLAVMTPIAHRQMVEMLPDGIIMLDDRQRIVEMNAAAARLTGLNPAAALGSEAVQVMAHWQELAVLLQKGRTGKEEIRLPAASESGEKTLEVTIEPVQHPAWGEVGRLVVLYDITERKQAAAELETQAQELARLATTDPLTGLYNRRYVENAFSQECKRSSRTHHALSVGVFDIDSFKRINDQFGHPTGDALLQWASQVLQKSVQASDVPARVGGDEFMVLFPETDPDDAWLVLDRLRQELAQAGAGLDLPDVSLTISGGVTGWLPGEAPHETLQRADRLLYQAKDGGKDRILRL